MRVFVTKWFARFARKEGLRHSNLVEAVRELESGLSDGELGNGLVKKRLARAGQGKRGSYRTIVVFQAGSRSVFLYGYAKSEKANLNSDELEVYRKLAKLYLRLSDVDIRTALRAGELEEVGYEKTSH